MAEALLRPCAAGSCETLVVSGRCVVHQRPSSHARGYTARWTRFRTWYLTKLNGLAALGIGLGAICGGRMPGAPVTTDSRCLAAGVENGRALQLDHLRPVEAGGGLYDLANLQVLCATCHSAKTARDDGGFGR
jgi:5-methylcytosine-specific restriction protein A